jgi:DNA-binding response OmpR family regulator
MVRQAHHERNQYVTVHPEPVEGLSQRLPKSNALQALIEGTLLITDFKENKMPLKTKPQGQFVVLMHNDNDVIHSLLKHRCQHLVLAKENNEILSLIKTTQFDLILLNSTNGSELLTLIKSVDCINNKTPVIALIDPTEDIRKKTIIAMGFNDYLINPITEEQLNAVIDLWLIPASALDYIQIILGKTNNNRRLALTIFNKLFEEIPLQISGIEDALENKQYALAKEITHKLNGSASFCELTDIQKLANALENCLLNKNYEAINRHFLMLQHCTLNLTSNQKAILANLSNNLDQ